MESKPHMTPTSSSIEARGRYIPWIIAGFFASFILLLSSFVWIAFSNKPSVVTENAYQKGLVYNQVLEKSQAQQQLGWNASLDVAEGKSVVLQLKDRSGAAIRGAVVEGWLVRPSSQAMDYRLSLKEASDGRYEAALELPQKGLWELHVTALYQGKQFQVSKSFEAR